MVAYTYSKLPTANFNTTPPSIARSATGSVYDVGDTGFTTPLNMTMVVGGAVVTTISSNALGFLPDFTLDGRVNCVWKQTGSTFATVLTTSDPIPGPPGPNTIPTDTAIASNITTAGTATAGALNATYVPATTDQTVTGSKTFSSLKGLRSTTWFGLGAGVGSARNPFYMNSIVDATMIPDTLAAGGGDDYVGFQTNIKFQGGFERLVTRVTGNLTSGSNVLTLTAGTFTAPITTGYTVWINTGSGIFKQQITSITDPTHAVLNAAATVTVTGKEVVCSLAADFDHLFASNDFYTTGTTAGDLSAITALYGRLTELHLSTPNTALTTMLGLQTQANVDATAAGSTITNLYSLKAVQPTNTAGATITNAYGLYASGTPTPGTTNSWGLYVDGGGKSKLTGATTITAPGASDVPLTVVVPLSASGDAFAVFDPTGTVKRAHIAGSNGAIGSSNFITSFEGLGSQTGIGSMSNGKSGIRFGVGGSTEIRLNNTAGVIEANAKFAAINGLGVGNSAAATTLGALSKKMEVFDAAGASLGFVPIYTTIS